MNILLVSPYPEKIIGAFSHDDLVEVRERIPEYHEDDIGFDWIVSFGCRDIFREKWINAYPGRIINIHIGFLPWNRGADPNFWSWFDDTPKGVTVHEIDKGIDTGPIFGHSEVKFKTTSGVTLKSSYDILMDTAPSIFRMLWNDIRLGIHKPEPQAAGGSYHQTKDKKWVFDQLSRGYMSPVEEVIKLGEESRR